MERNKRIAVFAGSFDSITNGHLDILSRASRIFDEVILLFANNPEKKSRFPYDSRAGALIATVTAATSLAYQGALITSGFLNIKMASSSRPDNPN